MVVWATTHHREHREHRERATKPFEDAEYPSKSTWPLNFRSVFSVFSVFSVVSMSLKK